ncbi:MAG: DNA polymerase Y family protein, partial [Phycisphaerales bacterium]
RPRASPRPTILLDPPEHARLTLASDGTPAELQWRGERHPIERARGPESIREEWWLTRCDEPGRGPVQRTYLAIALAGGRWVWLMHRAGIWKVHGEWA